MTTFQSMAKSLISVGDDMEKLRERVCPDCGEHLDDCSCISTIDALVVSRAPTSKQPKRDLSELSSLDDFLKEDK